MFRERVSMFGFEVVEMGGSSVESSPEICFQRVILRLEMKLIRPLNDSLMNESQTLGAVESMG